MRATSKMTSSTSTVRLRLFIGIPLFITFSRIRRRLVFTISGQRFTSSSLYQFSHLSVDQTLTRKLGNAKCKRLKRRRCRIMHNQNAPNGVPCSVPAQSLLPCTEGCNAWHAF
jgi:hypothetical protein